MDEALAQLTCEWLTKASHDLQTARINAGAAGGPLDTAIYHCQQAAEKTVKGWLTANNIPFEKTHDIRRLIRQAVGVLPEITRFNGAAEILTPYVSAFRYPGLTGDPMPSPPPGQRTPQGEIRVRRSLALPGWVCARTGAAFTPS